MLFDPTERNVDPFLFPTRKKLVLTSAIHDKYVTMAETAQVSLIIRTGPTLPSEDCGETTQAAQIRPRPSQTQTHSRFQNPA